MFVRASWQGWRFAPLRTRFGQGALSPPVLDDLDLCVEVLVFEKRAGRWVAQPGSPMPQLVDRDEPVRLELLRADRCNVLPGNRPPPEAVHPEAVGGERHAEPPLSGKGRENHGGRDRVEPGHAPATTAGREEVARTFRRDDQEERQRYEQRLLLAGSEAQPIRPCRSRPAGRVSHNPPWSG